MYDTPFENKYHIDNNYFGAPRVYGHIKLYQVGRVYCTEQTVVPRHTHLDFFELTIVTDGEGRVVTNGVNTEVSKGDVYVSFPGDFHEIISSERAPLRYDFLAMQTEDDSMHRDLEKIVSEFHSPKSRVIRNENINSLVSDAVAELNQELVYSDSIIGAMLVEIFAYVIRAFRLQEPIKRKRDIGDADILCYQIMNYIDNHIFSIKHLEELADITNYNYNYLSNLYKKVTGDTLNNYFRSRRLETAHLLLQNSTLSVTKIASLLNYASVYIFSRAYKERYGVSPSEQRKNK